MSTNGIQFSGLASGIDTASIVDALMAVERLPLQRLEIKKQEAQDEQSAARELNGYVTALRDSARDLFSVLSDPFGGKVATSANGSVATASAANSAAAGTYNITVSALAQSHTLQSAAAPALSDGDSLDITVGSSTISYAYSAADGLQGLADAINVGGDVSASVVNGSLVLISETSGTAGEITIGGTAAGALGFTEAQAAQDAAATVNGVAVTSSSNDLTGTVGGLDITLTGLGSTTVSVASDTQSAVDTVQAFVDAYNTVNSNFRAATKYDPESEVAGIFQGDQVFSGFMSQLRITAGNSVASLAGGQYDSLAQIGITAAKDGTLSFDTTKFTKALQSDPEGVESVFAAADGIAVAVSEATNTFSTQTLATRISGYGSEIARIDDQISSMEDRLSRKEASLQARFSAAESAIAAFQTQAAALSQGLSSIGA